MRHQQIMAYQLTRTCDGGERVFMTKCAILYLIMKENNLRNNNSSSLKLFN